MKLKYPHLTDCNQFRFQQGRVFDGIRRTEKPVKPVNGSEYSGSRHANGPNINQDVNFNFSLSFLRDLHLTAQLIVGTHVTRTVVSKSERRDLSYAIHWHYLRPDLGACDKRQLIHSGTIDGRRDRRGDKDLKRILLTVFSLTPSLSPFTIALFFFVGAGEN